MSSSFGSAFRVHTYGESHGGAVGAVVDGCPPGIELTAADIQVELDRRKPGQSKLTTPRKESDQVQILSGVFEDRTLGSPISLSVVNGDHRPEAYNEFRNTFRPSHADWTTEAKYGLRAWAGGGRASARETIGRVAAGAIAQKVLRNQFANNLEIIAWVSQVQDIGSTVDQATVTRAAVEDAQAKATRCPDYAAAEKMEARILEMRSQGNSVGGIIECVVRNCPAGWGEPIFDKLEADLAKAMLSLPATKGFEFGSGFAGTLLTGLEHNDAFIAKPDRIGTASNRSGGIQGGITNGEPIYFRVAFKPTATVMREQQTVDREGNEILLTGRGRHDPCVLPRAVPIVEAMTSLVLCDHALRQRGQGKWQPSQG